VCEFEFDISQLVDYAISWKLFGVRPNDIRYINNVHNFTGLSSY